MASVRWKMEEMSIVSLQNSLRPYKEPLRHPLLKWLYMHLPPQPIYSRSMHRTYSQVVQILMEVVEENESQVSLCAIIRKYLSAVLPFLEAYEKKEFPLGSATPEEVLQFLMEQLELSQYDIAQDFGGQSVVSNILNGKHRLTREHIERLSKRFHVSPASFYAAAA